MAVTGANAAVLALDDQLTAIDARDQPREGNGDALRDGRDEVARASYLILTFRASGEGIKEKEQAESKGCSHESRTVGFKSHQAGVIASSRTRDGFLRRRRNGTDNRPGTRTRFAKSARNAA